jgi:hypothetical protein
MIHPEHLRRYVIEPTLQRLGLDSEAAVMLLLGTAAVESRLGLWLRQLGGGPARGIYQMEPATHDSLWKEYLIYRTDDLAARIRTFAAPACPPVEQLEWNLAYATAMARVRYLVAPPALPAPTDFYGQAKYWKEWYQRGGEKGRSEGDYVRCVDDLILQVQRQRRYPAV